MIKSTIYSFIMLILITGCATTTNTPSKNADAHYNMAIAYLDTNNYPMAMRELETALKYNPNDAKIYYAISTYYLRKRQADKAKQYLLKAIALDKENSYYLNTYASLLASEGNQREALKVWNKVLEDPTYPTLGIVYFNMGYAYYQLKEFTSAANYYRRSIDESPKVMKPYLTLYDLYRELGDDQKAIEVLNIGIKNNPVSSALKLELGKDYYNKGDYEKAGILFNEILDFDKTSAEADEAKKYLKKLGLYYE